VRVGILIIACEVIVAEVWDIRLDVGVGVAVFT